MNAHTHKLYNYHIHILIGNIVDVIVINDHRGTRIIIIVFQRVNNISVTVTLWYYYSTIDVDIVSMSPLQPEGK